MTYKQTIKRAYFSIDIKIVLIFILQFSVQLNIHNLINTSRNRLKLGPESYNSVYFIASKYNKTNSVQQKQQKS